MTIAFISHPDCRLHEMGPHHAEQPARLSAIDDRLIASGLELVLRYHEAPLVTREQLGRVHDAGYLDEVYAAVPTDGLVWLDGGDTALGPHSLRAARRAAGAAVLGVDLVLGGQAGSAFCCVRPPGHHAERHRAMGFCIFNNVAVGAAHALEQHGLKRVAIVDFDVHHGNGTEDIFKDDPRVLFCSSFQHPFYPHSGYDTVSDHIVNVTLSKGSDGTVLREAVTERWLPALRQFRPELILVSAGFYGHAEDNMAYLRLREADYVWLTQQIKEVAEASAGGRIVSTLEGGYDLSALGRSVAAHLDALLG
jgi:acetoin utilization deacetylase AcuC-like enzyme